MITSVSEAAIGKILDDLYYGASDERGKGAAFERLCQSFLRLDPVYAERFDEVWLWSEWPDRGSRRDMGIDLVARSRDGSGLCAVQCKFYSPDHQVTKADVDTFLAESGKTGFTSRLFISTTNRWNRAAEDAIEDQKVPVNRIGVDDLFNSSIDWEQFSLDKPQEMVRERVKSLRPHQVEALDAVVAGLEVSDRGKLVMACGTGKTFTSLRIAQRITEPEGGRVLFLVPSIALLSQTLREWSVEAGEPLRSFAVCSDGKVNKGRSLRSGVGEDISVVDLAIPTTTDPERLAAGLSQPTPTINKDGHQRHKRPMTVVFCTYQSIDVIHRAQALGAPDFDLVICDEAHRTTGATVAGQDESAFVRVHDAEYIRASKRLYMTATPRVYAPDVKDNAQRKDLILASMDDEAVYGPELYRLGFGKAVEQGLLTDYKVLVLTVSEAQVSRTLQNSFAANGELALDDAARIVGCWNALAKQTKDPADYEADPGVMHTAVAFATNIKASKRFAGAVDGVVDDYLEQTRQAGAGEAPGNTLPLEARHVDGTMNVMERNEALRWLKRAPMEGDSCRILTNARCLSEGVDVPALDAVMFLAPRKSQVDVIQSVGRVMRRAEGKKYGYIILPVVIPVGSTPEEALNGNDAFRVVWEVLQALRAHDERFDAMVNRIDLNKKRPDQVRIVNVDMPVGDDADGKVDGDKEEVTTGVQDSFDLASLGKWQAAIYARLVKKVGTRRYWENWAGDVAKIVAAHTARLAERIKDPAVAPRFEAFVAALRANLNDSIDDEQAIGMLSQHLVSKPVFDALFEGYDFGADNPVARVMGDMLSALDDANLEAETRQLEGFYASVRERASGIDNAEGKQRVITELYEKFFKLAFKSTAEALGIVYTPTQVVDFILRSVDSLSRRHFGRGIGDEGVHVLDPFTGTGTFTVRLLQSGIVKPEDLARAYANELHANEILLLAYYIACANIEVAYRDLAVEAGILKAERRMTPEGRVEDRVPFVPFEGIVLADTFQMTEDGDVLDRTVFARNNERAEAQLGLDIQLIVGNPPYSVGQNSANDNNANIKYPTLDGRIERSYAKRSSATNKNSLYDSYIRAIRWATDRLGEAGVIGFVTNGDFIDANTSDGLRKSLMEDFDEVWVFNLRGNQRTTGELSRKEGGKIFDSGSRATVAITFLVKDPQREGEPVLRYVDIGEYLTRQAKLDIIENSRIEEMDWQVITPNEQGDWINQRDPAYETWQSIGEGNNSVFGGYSAGVQTNRDTWVYGSSKSQVRGQVDRLLRTYNSERRRVHAEGLLVGGVKVADVVTNDPTLIKWTSGMRSNLAKNRLLVPQSRIYRASYRPFNALWLDATDGVIHRPAIINRYFPTPEHDNYGFYLVGTGSDKSFSALMTSIVPDLAFWGSSSGQFFPRWTWEPMATDGFDLSGEGVVVDGYRRIDNITDATLRAYRDVYGQQVTKDDVFFYVYGLLHSPDYRTRYAADLKKSLPHIPMPATREAFEAFVRAGRELADLHMHYEQADRHPLTIIGDEPKGDPYAWYSVEKMSYGKRKENGKTVKDKTVIFYNSRIRVEGIPEEAQGYMLGARSGLDWIVERYQVRTDKASGIVNDPNDWSREVGNPRYILDLIQRVTTVSLRTQQIVGGPRDLDTINLFPES